MCNHCCAIKLIIENEIKELISDSYKVLEDNKIKPRLFGKLLIDFCSRMPNHWRCNVIKWPVKLLICVA